jgi:beta-N-acetylhexosaminidase
MDEMQAVASGTKALHGHAKRRAEAALARLPRTPEPFDVPEARARFAAAFPDLG